MVWIDNKPKEIIIKKGEDIKLSKEDIEYSKKEPIILNKKFVMFTNCKGIEVKNNIQNLSGRGYWVETPTTKTKNSVEKTYIV